METNDPQEEVKINQEQLGNVNLHEEQLIQDRSQLRIRKYSFSPEQVEAEQENNLISTQDNLNDDKKVGVVLKAVDVDSLQHLKRFFTEQAGKSVELLTFIHECSNTITERDCENLAVYLKRLPNLKQLELFLRLNKINEGIMFISIALPSLSKLERLVLRLQSNGISNKGLEGISNGLSQLKQLKEVELMLLGNEITDLSVFTCEGLNNIERLHFQVTKNSVTLDQVIGLTQRIKTNCSQLTQLTLDVQELKCDNPNSMLNFLDSIGELTNLKHLSLDLENSKITPEILTYFSNRLLGIPNLRKLSLNLKNNQLRDKGCQEIKNMLISLPALTNLGIVLDINMISQAGISELIEGITSLKLINQLLFSVMANQSDRINSIYSQILTKTKYLSQVQIYASGRFKQLSEQFANYYSQIYVMLLQMSVFINNMAEYQVFNPCFIMQELFYD